MGFNWGKFGICLALEVTALAPACLGCVLRSITHQYFLAAMSCISCVGGILKCVTYAWRDP